MSDGKILIELQKCDSEIARSRRELDELIEIKAIKECRAKRKEVKGKQDQVIEHTEAVENKIAQLQAEEEQIVLKMKELQKKLDSTVDYRETSSITRDMELQAKRQQEISVEQDTLLERQIKIDSLAEQVADALKKIDLAEEQHTANFKQKGNQITAHIEALEAQRNSLISQLDAALLKRYDALRAEKNGIAVCELDGDCCSVCRSIVPEGILSKLRKGSDDSECPNCHRIMVVLPLKDGEDS